MSNLENSQSAKMSRRELIGLGGDFLVKAGAISFTASSASIGIQTGISITAETKAKADRARNNARHRDLPIAFVSAFAIKCGEKIKKFNNYDVNKEHE